MNWLFIAFCTWRCRANLLKASDYRLWDYLWPGMLYDQRQKYYELLAKKWEIRLHKLAGGRDG